MYRLIALSVLGLLMFITTSANVRVGYYDCAAQLQLGNKARCDSNNIILPRQSTKQANLILALDTTGLDKHKLYDLNVYCHFMPYYDLTIQFKGSGKIACTQKTGNCEIKLKTKPDAFPIIYKASLTNAGREGITTKLSCAIHTQ